MDWGIAPNGLLLPARLVRKPIAIDLFCGAGGFSLGFIQAGWKVVAAVDNDEYAALTYMTNLGSYPINIHFVEEADKERLNAAIEKQIELNKKNGVYHYFDVAGSGWIKHNPDAEPVRDFWFGDIRKISGKDMLKTLGLKEGDVDCIIGGPPCQGFSRAGKQNIMDPRNSLVYEFARMVVEIQPKMFVMENVPDILKMMDPDGVPVIDKFCLMLQEGGYGRWEMIKKALVMQANYGAVIKNYHAPAKRYGHIKEKRMPKAEQLSLFGELGRGWK